MLGIEFLNKPAELQFAGQEFMDYQKGDLFKDLVKILNVALVQEGNDWTFSRAGDTPETIEEVIMYHTGILIELSSEQVPNAAVDAGYINPGNVLNIKGIEDYFSAKDSNVGQTFKRLKTDILKGWVDTSTGRIGGDFSKVQFKLYLNNYVSYFIKNKTLQRYKVSMAEALAGIIIHECGHVFTGFLHVYRGIVDPIVATSAIKLIVEGKQYGKQRVDIVKEAFKIMEIGQKVDESALENMTGDELVIYFNKAAGTRDTRRTLSLGTQDRSSEIYADLYSVRMGCPKSMIAALAAMDLGAGVLGTISVYYTAATILSVITCNPVLAVLCGTTALFMALNYLGSFLSPNSSYDSPYRRVKTILRDYVVQINNAKDIDSRAKVKTG